MKNISQLGTCRFFLQPMYMYIYISLVGGIPTPLKKKLKVGWDDYSQNMDKYKMFQTTTQIYIYIYMVPFYNGYTWLKIVINAYKWII